MIDDKKTNTSMTITQGNFKEKGSDNPFKKEGIFIDLHADLVAGIKAFSQCICLADIMADGDWRLISADINCKLKVFKGQILQSETKLHFTPVAIASFYAPDTNAKNCN